MRKLALVDQRDYCLRFPPSFVLPRMHLEIVSLPCGLPAASSSPHTPMPRRRSPTKRSEVSGPGLPRSSLKPPIPHSLSIDAVYVRRGTPLWVAGMFKEDTEHAVQLGAADARSRRRVFRTQNCLIAAPGVPPPRDSWTAPPVHSRGPRLAGFALRSHGTRHPFNTRLLFAPLIGADIESL
jgi:hypothetical protein